MRTYWPHDTTGILRAGPTKKNKYLTTCSRISDGVAPGSRQQAAGGKRKAESGKTGCRKAEGESQEPEAGRRRSWPAETSSGQTGFTFSAESRSPSAGSLFRDSHRANTHLASGHAGWCRPRRSSFLSPSLSMTLPPARLPIVESLVLSSLPAFLEIAGSVLPNS